MRSGVDADDDRGDRVELVPGPGLRLRRRQARGQQHPGHRREQPGQRVDQQSLPGDLDAGQVFGQIGIDIGGRVLELAVGAAGELAEDDREDHDEGHKAEHHQRQLVVQAEHGHQNAQNDKAVLGQLNQEVGEHHGDGVGIVGHSGDQLAHRDLVELLVCQRFNVAEQILAQIGDDALAHPLQDHGLQVSAAHREHQHACIH